MFTGLNQRKMLNRTVLLLQVVWNTDNVGMGVHFNTLVPWRDQVRQINSNILWHSVFSCTFLLRIKVRLMSGICLKVIKYGVIRTSDLVKDLSTWSSFYTAGRMQKPVLQLQESLAVLKAQERNLDSALRLALLLLPDQFSTQV